jgi:exonuclease III
MIIISWNYQVLGNPQAVWDLCRLVKEKKPHLVFLMETKLQAHRMEKIRLCIGFESVLVINSVGRREGLALLWSSEVEVDI